MSDFSDAELVSAVLDGEASDADVARVEGDPRLRAELVRLRAVRDALAAPVPPPADATRERHLEAAVRSATVVDLGARRRRLRLVSVAAAVIVAVLVGGALLRARGSGSTTTTAASAPSSFSAVGAPVQGGTTAATSQERFGAVSADLGVFAGRDDLVAAIRARTSSLTTNDNAGNAAAPGAPADQAASTPCAVPGAVFLASATLDGRPVEIFVARAPTPVAHVLDAGCVEVFSQAL